MAKLASTLLLCRPSGNQFKVLMVRRSNKSRAFSGAHVFPGGIVEQSDYDPFWSQSLSEQNNKSHLLHLQVAAIRELFEETDVLMTNPPLSTEERKSWRTSVRSNASEFINLCKTNSAKPLISQLRYISNWITPTAEKWRYDTHFFLMPLSEVEGGNYYLQNTFTDPASPDHSETTECTWFTPSEALDAFESGNISLMPPTWYLLYRLSSLSSLSDVDKLSWDLNPIQPVLKFENEGMIVALPGDELNNGNVGQLKRIISRKNKYTLIDEITKSQHKL